MLPRGFCDETRKWRHEMRRVVKQAGKRDSVARLSQGVTVIPLGRALPRSSSHLPADSVGHVVVRLLDVAPRRDCRVSPGLNRLVSVALILASRRTGVTRYAALWSPDFPLCDMRGTATAWLASHRHFTAVAGNVLVKDNGAGTNSGTRKRHE